MFFRELAWAFKSIFRSKARSTAAIAVTAVTIFLMSTTLLLGIAGANFGRTARERFTLPVYLSPSADSNIAENMSEQIKLLPNVKDVKVLTPDDLLKKEGESLHLSPEQIIQSISYNPLPYSLVVVPENPQNIDALAKRIKQFTMVEDVDYESDVINKFVNLFDLFIWIALGLAVLSILVSSIVIGSTISLSIASRIEEIEVMSFVGASPGTILGPFIIEGIFYGLIGGGISAAGIYFGWKYLQAIFQTNLPWFNLSIGQTVFYSIVAGTVVFGFLTGLITSWLSSRNTLRRIRA